MNPMFGRKTFGKNHSLKIYKLSGTLSFMENGQSDEAISSEPEKELSLSETKVYVAKQRDNLNPLGISQEENSVPHDSLEEIKTIFVKETNYIKKHMTIMKVVMVFLAIYMYIKLTAYTVLFGLSS